MPKISNPLKFQIFDRRRDIARLMAEYSWLEIGNPQKLEAQYLTSLFL